MKNFFKQYKQMLQELNYDCLENILLYLNISSLLYLSKTNSYFNKIINESILFYKNLVIQHNIPIKIKNINYKNILLKSKGLFCEICNKYIGKKRNLSVKQLDLLNETSLFACLDCRYNYVTKKYVLEENDSKVTKSDTCYTYLIPENILELFDIDYTEHRNPMFRNASNMKLYNQNDIIKMSYAYNGRLDIIAKKRPDISFQRSYTMYRNSFGEYNKYYYNQELDRRNELSNALNNVGLILRNDSVLCNNYIENNENTIQEIVEIMLEMDWFFKYTKYSTLRFQNVYIDSENGKRLAINDWCKIRFP